MCQKKLTLTSLDWRRRVWGDQGRVGRLETGVDGEEEG